MDNISLIPKKEKGNLPGFATFQGPKFEFSRSAKVGLGLAGLTALIWAGLYFWQLNLQDKIKTSAGERQQLVGQRDMSSEERLKNLNVLLEVFKRVLTGHREWSKFFSLLEQKTINTVTFNTFKADDAMASVVLDGSVLSYSALAQQIKVLEETQGILNVVSSNIALAEDGRISFSLSLNISKELVR